MRLATVLILLVVSMSASPGADYSPRKRVLIIESFGQPPATAGAVTFRNTLEREFGQPVDIYHLSMDVARFAGPHHEAELADFLQSRYQIRKLDLVAAMQAPAVHFVGRQRERLFAGTPVVVTGIERRRVPPGLHTLTTHVAGEIDLPGQIENILQLLPDTRRITMLYGASAYDKFWSEQSRKEFQRFAGRVEIEWVEGLSLDDMRERVTGLSAGNVVLLGLLVLDAAGIQIGREEVLERLHEVSRVPIFGLFESYVGKGIVGGRLYADVTQGAEAARVAIRVLKGEAPDTIAPLVIPQTRPIYDWRELNRFGIGDDRLPPDSEVRYRRQTVWEAYRWHIAATVALLILQAALIAGLALERARHLKAQAERQRAEAALRESEERFRMIANTAPVMIWMTDADHHSIFFNNGWLAFTGRTLEQESSVGWAEGVHREDLGRCLEVRGESFNARQSFTLEFRLRRWDGEYRWLLDTGVPRFEHDGTFVGFTGSCIDVTDRKQSADVLRHEQAFLRQVIDIDPNLIFAKDRESRFTLVNQATADLYGTTVENLVGKTHADFCSNVTEVEHFHRIDREVMDTLQERFIPEEQITDAEGQVRWLQTVKRPIVDEHGRANQLLGSATDITGRKEAELELARQRNELAHLSRVTMLGEMSGSLAHELNQPLTAILSNAQAAQRLLARDECDLDEVREILKDIVNDDKRAGEVIHGLRQLLKKGEVQHQPVDLNDLVRDVIRLVRSDLLNHAVHLNADFTPNLPMIVGDHVQLQQVLLNLVVNGYEAMSDVVGMERQLTLRTAVFDEKCVCVSVTDRGHGIPPEHLERVFDPFFTTKAQGLGLGLAVCRTIVSAQGGSLWAENTTPRGASFQFTVPRVRAGG